MEFTADSITTPTDRDLRRVFVYSEAPATVIKILQSEAKLIEEEFKDEEEWDKLIQEKLPSVTKRNGDSGLVLLITPRMPYHRHSTSSKSPEARSDGNKETAQLGREIVAFENAEFIEHGGQRQPRVLPFSRDVSSRVMKAFYTHRSISPTINRADVPFFSHEKVFMKDELGEIKAMVYNCRSSHAWGGDLAMTVTHFPHRNLSFGILFGCTDYQKQYVVERLNLAIQASGHPLLLPGIFAEIERQRHDIIFNSSVHKLELMIPESDMEGLFSQEQSGDHSNRQDRRTVYLDMLHLKHGLTSWSQQLKKMLEHAWSLDKEYLEALHPVDIEPTIESSEDLEHVANSSSEGSVDDSSLDECPGIQNSTGSLVSRLNIRRDFKFSQEIMAKTNARIIGRLNTILEDYGDKIRECQTRFDGLAMTTQLFQGETSMLLALAASKDSRHMRTIALVTMVFLPGTFFATVFSMTFFNWKPADGESAVSSLFWVYIAFSVVSTVVTLLAYYYFVSIRPKKSLSSPV
ncbi:hypothetical protein F4803DRAFT_543320 [Xylaria telfairii]|nr:hypothetical protein F4803DRAFT_543320 [Xylaria telfairii]